MVNALTKFGLALSGNYQALNALEQQKEEEEKRNALAQIMKGFQPTPMADGMVGTPTPPKYSSFEDAVPAIGEYFPEMALKYYAEKSKGGLDTGKAYKQYVASTLMGQQSDPKIALMARVHELTNPELGGRMFNPNTGEELTKMPSVFGGALGQMSQRQQQTEQPYALSKFYKYTDDQPPASALPQVAAQPREQASALPQVSAPQSNNQLTVSGFLPPDFNQLNPKAQQKAIDNAQSRYNEDVKLKEHGRVEGLEMLPNTVPSKENADKVRMAAYAKRNLDSLFKEYEKLVDKYGIETEGSPEAKLIQSKEAEIHLQLKALYDLGALQAPDIQVMASAMGSPVMENIPLLPIDNIRHLGTKLNKGKQSSLDTLKSYKAGLDRDFQNIVTGYGYTVPQGSPFTKSGNKDSLGLED